MSYDYDYENDNDTYDSYSRPRKIYRPAQHYRRLSGPKKAYRNAYGPSLSGSSKRDEFRKLDREDVIQKYDEHEPVYEYEKDYGYWDTPTIDYDSGDYLPEDTYSDYYEPGHVHQPGYESEHRYAHDRWTRRRYGMGSGIPEYWTDRKGDYDTSMEAQYPDERGWDEQYPSDYYYSEAYYVDAPEYYRDRYMPTEDSLKKLYMRMFRNIDYNIKVPVMQVIATGALFFIFILNYLINIEYVIALSKFSPWVAVQPPMVAAILGALFGIFLYLFPNLDRDIRRTVIIGTIILLIFFFAGPALLAWIAENDLAAIGNAFADTIEQFLKLAAVLVYWAPIFLGIYGIWTKNSFYIGASAMFMFLIIIILDVYLFYEGLPINKIRDNWLQYVIFSIILFCYMEMSDSAITFARFTSVRDKDSIDPGYYEHLDKILEKYFVYFILLTIFIIILSWITLNFAGILKVLGSIQVGESLEISSIYGSMISLIIIGIIILFIGLFIRYEGTLRKIANRLSQMSYRIKLTDQYSGRRKKPYAKKYSSQIRNRPTRIRR